MDIVQNAVGKKKKCHLLSISFDCLYGVFSYLKGTDYLLFSFCNRACLSASIDRQSRAIWTHFLNCELGLKRAMSPPGRVKVKHTNLMSERDTYLAWRDYFKGYSSEEIKLANSWWTRMLSWLEGNAPYIKATLNPPATIDEIQQAEEALGRPIPRFLALLYRFYNGQNLLHDEYQLGDTLESDFSRTFQAQELERSIFSGLFGGYVYYENMVNMRFLPLKHMVFMNNEFFDNGSNLVAEFDKPVDLRSFSAQTARYQLNNTYSKYFIFSTSAFLGGTVDKLFAYCPSRVNGEQQSQVTESAGCDSIFVNYGGLTKLIPACECDSDNSRANSGISKIGGALFKWLYEYLARLETGYYITQPVDLHTPGPSAPNALSMISLFPQRIFPSASHTQPAAADSTSSSLSSPPVSGRDQRTVSEDSSLLHPLRHSSLNNLHVSHAVTNGIEVVASAIFVPEKSRDIEMLWTYSIRLRLLRDHPSRKPYVKGCQLLSRHWITRTVNPGLLLSSQSYDRNNSETFAQTSSTEQDFVVANIDGAGVIGLHPILSVEYSQDGASYLKSDWPFAYQSCMMAPASPCSLGGSLRFIVANDVPARPVATSMVSPPSPQMGYIVADVQELTFSIPDIIF